MSIETRGQWIRIGETWIDADAVIGVWKDGVRVVVTVAGLEQFAGTTEHTTEEILEAVHRARRFVGADLVSLPSAKPSTSAEKAWRACSSADRAVVGATLEAGAAKAKRDGFNETAALLRTAAALLEEAGGSA
jgi:hypothetical protein